MIGDGDKAARRARKLLGVGAAAQGHAVRAAFREAAKKAHPDRGGDAAKFRQVIEAYRLLQAQKPAPIAFPPAPAQPRMAALDIGPLVAAMGGVVETKLNDGRAVRITLPAGLREGDKVRAGGEVMAVVMRGDRRTLVRGDDLWITVKVAPALLAEGGRTAIDTPLGRRIVWITRKAGERGLLRLPGQGLPARGSRPQGHLFLRLEPEAQSAESPARTLLRRFAAAWAA